MQVYNDFAVLEIHEEVGTLTLAWYDATPHPTLPNQLATPITQQHILVRAHKIPIEAEQNNWTREQLRQFWELEVEDVADIPQWAHDEVGRVVLDTKTVVRRTRQ